MRRFAKWVGIVLGLLIVVAVVLALTGKKTFRTEITIAAPPAAVWAVLTDAKAYSAWNPVFVKVVGTYGPGAKIKNFVKAPGQKVLEIDGTVITFTPNKEMRQKGGMMGLLTYDHRWQLVPDGSGTKVIQYEVDRGLFMWFWDSGWILPSYRRVNEALKKRVMALQR